MAGVSDTGAQSGSAEMQLIMDGGANWMARMTAFLKAKEDAQVAIDHAGIVGDIAAIRDEARADRVAAAQALSDAKTSAVDIVSAAQTKADEIVAAATAQAEKLVADATVDADDSAKRAQAAEETSLKRLADADTAAVLAERRAADLKAQSDALAEKATALDAAKAEADAVKARFEDLLGKLREALDGLSDAAK
jgi:cell division septum initiation protein DivIVA